MTLKAPLALSEPNEQACVEQMQLYTNDDELFFQGQNVSRLQVELNVEKQQTGQPWRLCLMQIKIKTQEVFSITYCSCCVCHIVVELETIVL